ncbi:transglutaminaseTgpA domain-containing protein [Actinosynnema sp. NPDC047251]|uniref:Transglutaminase-like domain-containing protein n=1 Tax=Saccharothrix espanaensis (strain ATCC 51144 / DSM 44229 / JCM 9112 / NBRC 15066 / NRRL 15764) TaxID=1179773 RepID=K0K7P3_SACES|nr:transglutaminaseTgpA domain-containing protein [Saccharothrix espanaensis]CCH32628.1 hypothetical protein BN6_53680 [Saccharothrix espanaensis DSM 44229]
MNRQAAFGITRPVLAIVAGVLAGLAFGPVFGGAPRILLITGAAAVAVAAVVVVTVVLLPRAPAALMSSTGLVLVVLAAVAVSGRGVDVVDGPRLLLTGALPADPEGPLPAVVAIVVGWTCLTAGLAALWSTNPLVPLLPPVVCLVLALSLGSAGPALPWWLVPALVLTGLGVLLTARTHPPSRGFLVGAALVSVPVVVATAVLGPVAPGVGVRPPADARELLDAPVVPRSGVSPLQQFLALRNGSRPVRLSGSMSRHVDRLRMASLEDFTGTYWNVRADYRRAGRTLPSPDRPGATEVVSRITVTAPGPLAWLPTPGRARTVDTAGLGVSETTGDLVVPEDRPFPENYTVTTSVGTPDPDRIRAASPVRIEPAGDPLPAPLRAFTTEVVRGQPSGSASVLALLTRFTAPDSGFLLDEGPDAAGGHGLYQIGRLLETRRGTPEQYASAYAVLLGGAGYHARVVMGFRPRFGGAPESTAFTVTEKDVDVWTEVEFEGLGWVTVDPSPRANTVDTRVGATKPATGMADAAQQAAQDQHDPPTASTPDPITPGDVRTPEPSTLPWVVSASALVALLIAAVPTAKALRRARRRSAPPKSSVRGAWQEAVDRLTEVGVPVHPTMTRAEVVATTAHHGALTPQAQPLLATLSTAANEADYAPDPTAEAAVGAAWRATRDIRRAALTTAPPLRRLTATLNPRTLFPRGSRPDGVAVDRAVRVSGR